MNFIMWLLVGGVIGWLASIVMKTNGQQGIFLNLIVGIVGAMVGGWFISPLVGGAPLIRITLVCLRYLCRLWARLYCLQQ
jgi:uncharacterized membrane protein YeaQ/YmgE (transglycosylase-associated protein family)